MLHDATQQLLRDLRLLALAVLDPHAERPRLTVATGVAGGFSEQLLLGDRVRLVLQALMAPTEADRYVHLFVCLLVNICMSCIRIYMFVSRH